MWSCFEELLYFGYWAGSGHGKGHTGAFGSDRSLEGLHQLGAHGISSVFEREVIQDGAISSGPRIRIRS